MLKGNFHEKECNDLSVGEVEALTEIKMGIAATLSLAANGSALTKEQLWIGKLDDLKKDEGLKTQIL